MKNLELLEGILPFKHLSPAEIESIVYDSRRASAGSLFVALSGFDHDGHDYAQSAYDQGCRDFLIEKPVHLPEDARLYLVPNTRRSLSQISARFYGHPHRQLTVIGMTGTKGKTTTSQMLRHILEEAGIPTGLIGTMGIFYGERQIETQNTTPESLEIHRHLRDMVEYGMKAVVMEVSSGGLMNHRVDDVDFDIGLFLNLYHDHIGEREHPDFEHYRDTKASFFQRCQVSFYNDQDPYSQHMMQRAKGEIKSFGEGTDAFLRFSNYQQNLFPHPPGSQFDVERRQQQTFVLPFPGKFNASNATAAAAIAMHMGIDLKTSAKALQHFRIEGRFQWYTHRDRHILIDYAHNGMALQHLLKAVKAWQPQRILLMMGSVGDRTQNRRGELSQVAADKVDMVFLTEDNPGFEDPQRIIDEMAEYFRHSSTQVLKCPVREEAIGLMLDHSEAGDLLILAGKGHENYNLVKGVKEAYNEKEALLRQLKKRHWIE